jgi:hypothetical protein
MAMSNWLRVARWPAAAALVILLVVWNVVLQRELTRRAPGPAPGPEVEALSRRPGRIVISTEPGSRKRTRVPSSRSMEVAISR